MNSGISFGEKTIEGEQNKKTMMRENISNIQHIEEVDELDIDNPDVK